MKNLSFHFSLADGSGMPFSGCKTGKELIELIVGDDVRPPIRNMSINIEHTDGKVYKINIPSDSNEAFLTIHDFDAATKKKLFDQ